MAIWWGIMWQLVHINSDSRRDVTGNTKNRTQQSKEKYMDESEILILLL